MIDSLYDKFKTWCARGSIYIISDTHFDDIDCKLMNPNWITPQSHIDIIKKSVHKNDTLIHLGDVGNPKWLNQLKCYKVLIKGNHDVGSSYYLKHIEDCVPFSEAETPIESGDVGYTGTSSQKLSITRLKREGYFDEVYEGPLFIGKKILLSHEPLPSTNWINLHGHVHNGKYRTMEIVGEETERATCIITYNFASDVTNFNVINLKEIINSGDMVKIDSIHRKTINVATERKLNRIQNTHEG